MRKLVFAPSARVDLQRKCFEFWDARIGEDDMQEKHSIILDPDGAHSLGHYAIVSASTGLTYQHQCAGVLHEIREAEGFLVPIGPAWKVEAVENRFRKLSYDDPISENDSLVDELSALVEDVLCFTTEDYGYDAFPLRLDKSKIAEAVIGWLPVITPYGPGYMVLHNFD